MGNGKSLTADVRENLIDGLRDHPTTLIFLALCNERPVGIAVCFRGFSTFAAKPLFNIHNIYIVPEMRGNGFGRLLLENIEAEARATGCCKLTLEVLENNKPARCVYSSFGFSQAVYVADAGGALFMAKSLQKSEI
ncbi:MAG: GNAT family N-acetyltransferase [Pirellulales bacterium]|nr:GNAT family N-acetyltransferase [Pirellulales bacterium]